jgi:carboxypeptidase A2
VHTDDSQPPQTADYTGHVLIRTQPINDSHLQLLESLADDTVDFWKHPTIVKRSVDLRVSPQSVGPVSIALTDAGLHYDVIAEDLQRLLNEDRRERSSPGQISPDHFNLSSYNTFDNIARWLNYICTVRNLSSLAASCETLVIGKSSEGRNLTVIKFGSIDETKPAIWIDAGIHAREWIAPATALQLIDKLLDYQRADRQSRLLLTNFRWYFLPVANPDGYVFTWTTDRLWRKNRSRDPDQRTNRCRGVDLNRNWNFHWSGPGTSVKPCNEDFAGRRPFSEPETRAIADFLLSLRTPTAVATTTASSSTRTTTASSTERPSQLAVYLSLHSYGQYWLTPWGFTYRLPTDYNDMVLIASEATEAIRRTHGRRYTVGPSSHLMYLASGGSDDWAKAVAGVRYSYTVELRDGGRQGFLLSASHIDASGDEMYNAVRAMAVGVLRQQQRNQRRRQKRSFADCITSSTNCLN